MLVQGSHAMIIITCISTPLVLVYWGVGWGWEYDIGIISQLIYCHPLHLLPQLNISHLLTHVKWIDQFADSTHVEKVPALKKK